MWLFFPLQSNVPTFAKISCVCRFLHVFVNMGRFDYNIDMLHLYTYYI